ncbi:TlpA family protein disulfide reductase [Nocardia asteroides]|uniref:TlpA family protein disulfide reductase n=1 Tax=Nocardia asteroides TaxID=1824 RepID=UPI001E329BBE|nr:TlpA disulfide reductase family protein [Nocardia asteroides]UGT52923.1 TlpA family protein disulfide reductase [Nocardia asteroides]
MSEPPEPSPIRRLALRWALAALILVIAAAVALWPRTDSGTTNPGTPAARQPAAVSAEERAAAGLAPCPTPTGPGAGPLAGITLTCLADGAPVDLAAALAGKPALLNLWAYWCGPCAVELPHLQEFARRAGPELTVLTVHSDPDEAKALARLSGLGITLPGVEDPTASVRTAAGAPAVLPVSVLVRADGTIASVEVRTFADVADIADTVADKLGVRIAV